MRAYLLLPLLALVGCKVWPDNYDVYISPAATKDDENIVRAAAYGWMQAVPVTFNIKVEDHNCAVGADTAICVEFGTAHDLRAWSGKPGELGRDINFVGGGSYVSLASDVLEPTPIRYVVCAMHEFGHAMGLMHTGKGTLMAPQYSDASHTLTCTDIQQWYSLRGQNHDCP